MPERAGSDMSEVDAIQAIAREFHRVYERMARALGWETQESTRVEFDELPEANRDLMLSVVGTLLKTDVIDPGKRLWDRHVITPETQTMPCCRVVIDQEPSPVQMSGYAFIPDTLRCDCGAVWRIVEGAEFGHLNPNGITIEPEWHHDRSHPMTRAGYRTVGSNTNREVR